MIAEIEKAHIECLEVADNNTYGRFAVEPLERGFGHTNGLPEVLTYPGFSWENAPKGENNI